MATAAGNSLSEDGHCCPICLDVFTTPRQLPCLHSFCGHCLEDYITKKASATKGTFEEFMCPVCRAITRPEKKDKLVREWSSLFPISPISLVVESKVKVERLCDICSSRKSSNLATKICTVCGEAMCDDCSFAHQTMKISRNHKMMSVEELEINPQNRVRFAEGFGCPEDHDKEIEFYCKIHEVACCGTCLFVQHKACQDVLELKTNLTDLLYSMNPQRIMEEMIKLVDSLTKFIEVNETNIGILESCVSGLSAQISEIRTKINFLLDDIEKAVKSEGDRLYKDESIKKQEQNHKCQSLINAIRNSHALLETINRIGTDKQKFLVTSKTTKQLQSYSDQIKEKFERVHSIKILLEFDSHLKAVISQDGKGLVKVVCKEETEILHSTSNMKPLGEYMVELSRVINVNCSSDQDPSYSGVVQLQGGEIVLVDYNNRTCCLYDSSYNFITMYKLPGKPYDMCLTDDNEVAVTLPEKKTVQFLSIKDRAIKDAGKVKNIYQCHGVAAVNKWEIVMSGNCTYFTKCDWSLVSKDGKVKIHREFDCQSTNEASIALNRSKSRVCISVFDGHAVYCFGLADGRKYFVYTADNLKQPVGVAVDRDDNVYIVGYGSHNIHKLSPDGVILHVICSGVPNNPGRISFNVNRDQFILTNDSAERKTLHCFILK